MRIKKYDACLSSNKEKYKYLNEKTTWSKSCFIEQIKAKNLQRRKFHMSSNAL